MPDDSAAPIQITPYQTADRAGIRPVLEHIGWDEPYILAFEQTAEALSANENAAVLMARRQTALVGFIFVQCHAWNRLAQIQGLAVDPAFQRQGVASTLVAHAEAFARAHCMRGIYVDTPTTNERGWRFYEATGYQVGYVMPRYYEDALDGVTYQKFFDDDADCGSGSTS